MAALLNSDDLLEELELDASVAPADVYTKFVLTIIERSVLPRKILIQSAKRDFEILANQGEIAGLQELEAKSGAWVKYPLPEAKQHALEALEDSAGDALRNGELSVSMVSKRERAELASGNFASAPAASAPSEVVSLDNWKQGKGRNKPKASVTASPVLASFFASLKSKVKFVYLEDEASGPVQVFGASGVIDKDVSAGLKPSILKWKEAVMPSLGSAPLLLTMRGPSVGGASLICAVDGRQFLLAEFETKNFGVVAGLWTKAQSK